MTDHKPLEWLPTVKDTSDRLLRWSLKLQGYNYKTEYRKGKDHGNVDALSRIVLDVNQEEPEQEKQTSLPLVAFTTKNEELAELQKNDKALEWYFKQAKNPKSSYMIQDGLLCKKTTPVTILVPTHLRKEILREFHDDKLSGGHLRFQKCLGKIQQRFWWPRMRQELKEWLDACIECQTRYPNGITSVDTMMNIDIAGPWDMIGMDIVGPIQMSDDGRFILVITDYLTKWAEAFPIADHTAEIVAKILMEKVIAKYGAPRRILTDRGKEFLSEIMADVLSLLGIKKISTTAYHPQTDGLVERFNRTLISMLSMYTTAKQTDWDQHIPYVLFAYNSSKHASTGFSPYFLMHGREPNFTIDSIKPFKHNFPTPESYADHVRKVLELAFKRAKEMIAKAQQRQKEYYEKHKRETPVFEKGDLVLYWMQVPPPGVTVKLLHRWYGPYQVMEKKSPVNYVIRDPRGDEQPFVVHVNTVKKFVAPSVDQASVATSQYYPEEDDQDQIPKAKEPTFVNDPAPDLLRAELDIGIEVEKEELPRASDPDVSGKQELPVSAEPKQPRRNVQSQEALAREAVQDRDAQGKRRKPISKTVRDLRTRIATILDKKDADPKAKTPLQYLLVPEGQEQAIWVDAETMRERYYGSDAMVRAFDKKLLAAN